MSARNEPAAAETESTTFRSHVQRYLFWTGLYAIITPLEIVPFIFFYRTVQLAVEPSNLWILRKNWARRVFALFISVVLMHVIFWKPTIRLPITSTIEQIPPQYFKLPAFIWYRDLWRKNMGVAISTSGPTWTSGPA